MAKIALVFLVVFLCVQMAVCIREKRRADEGEVEATTADWTDAIKSGIEKTFTEENFQKGVDFLTGVLNKARNASETAIEKGKQLYNEWQATTPAPA